MYSSDCIQSQNSKRLEKQSISIKPYFKVDGDVKIVPGLKGVLFSKDPSNFVYENYIFSRSSRSVIDQIVLGPLNEFERRSVFSYWNYYN